MMTLDFKVISLLATKETLSERITGDVAVGTRTIDVLERSVARIPFYQAIDSAKVNTDGKTIDEITDEILRL